MFKPPHLRVPLSGLAVAHPSSFHFYPVPMTVTHVASGWAGPAAWAASWAPAWAPDFPGQGPRSSNCSWPLLPGQAARMTQVFPVAPSGGHSRL